MRLSLVEDYDDGDEGSSPSQDSVSLDIATSQHKQIASYTNLFDTSQPTPVGAMYQQAKSGSPHHTRPKDLRYDRSPRPNQVKPPLALPEDFSPTDSSKRTNVSSPGAGRPYSSKPPVGQMRSTNNIDRGQSAMYNSKNNGYPARSSSAERFRDIGRNTYESNYSGNSRYPDAGTRKSADHLDQQRGRYSHQGNNRTLPYQNRFENNASANQNANATERRNSDEAADFQRPMSFVKALEMSEVMQKAREVDQTERQRNEEKKRSVYDSAYEISV